MLARIAQRLLILLPGGVVRWLGRAQFRIPLLRKISVRVSGRIGETRIPRGPAKGLLIDATGAHPGYAAGTSEPQLQEVLAAHLRPGDVLYDLGANIGFFTLLGAKLVGPTGHVVAFEPDHANAELLRANVARNSLSNVVVIEAGVSDSTGTRSFSSDGTTESRLTDSPGGNRVTTVHVTSLDELLAQGEHRPPTVIKMDIEGEEIRALSGASKLLADHRPVVICEIHGTGPEVRRLLEDSGYHLYLLEDEPAEWHVHLVGAPVADQAAAPPR